MTAALPAFVAGHVIRTTNRAEADPAGALIPGLWGRVLADAALFGMPGRVGSDVFAVLFDYESDETGAYSQLVGVGVDTVDAVPPGVALVAVGDEARVAFDAAGEMPAALVAAWGRVWAASAGGSLDRAFGTDVEVHRADGTAEVLVSIR